MQDWLKITFFLLATLFWATGCREHVKPEATGGSPESMAPVDPPEIQATQGPALRDLQTLPDTAFVRLSDFSPDFSYDLRYATTDNFMKEAVYDCPKCYTRARTARALIAANREFMKKGVRIRFFDCYRPNSVQYKMWEIMPNPQYVANPV
jgi:D-alanyl-D-alanine dipeptidase